MNRHAIYHEPDSNQCYPLDTNKIVIRLKTSRQDNFDFVKLIYGNKYTFHELQEETMMSIKYQDELFNYYEVNLTIKDVRFVYVFCLSFKNQTYYYCEDGLSKKYNFAFAYYNCFQYPYINQIDIPKKVSWMEKSVFYNIFVDRFYQGNTTKDQSYINLKVNEIPKPKSFMGGDIKGIIEKLDYLQDLGITAIYLTPIFTSISSHKYDISNYFEIDKQFGSKEDLEELITKAHNMGIKIVLDGVFNHCSNLSREFQDALQNGKDSKYFNWFIINGDKIDTKNVNYETFSSCYYHPKFNTSNPEVQEFLISIGLYYVNNFKIDGWRLDVADELSHDFWRNFRTKIKAANPECLLIGENWHNSYPFLRGDQFDSIMNYSFTKIMQNFFAYNKIKAAKCSDMLNNLIVRNNDIANSMMLNLLDSHDTDRFFSSVNKNLDKMIAALAILFTFKGVPGIYYGTELPLEGKYDPDNRRPMNFNKLGKNANYFSLLKKLIKIRNDNELLSKGEISITSDNDLLFIKRYFSLDEYIELIVYNGNKKKEFVNKNEILLKNNYEDTAFTGIGFIIRKVKI